jgi:HlyD family secretion protein
MIAKLLLSGLTMVVMLAAIWLCGPFGRATLSANTLAGPGSVAVPEPRAERVIAEGRLVTYPGAEVVVATELAGTIVRLPVREKSIVIKGDLIAELGSDELRASREEAVARIEEAEAEIHFYEREVERRRVLIARRAASDVELDTNQRGLDVSRARRRAAIAARDRLDALLAKTRITSPIDGIVIARFADPGETLAIAAPLVTVADLSRVRIEAEVDEIDCAGVAVGAEAIVFAEGFAGENWRGRVEEVPDVVVGRHLRPDDTSRPVDTRVLLVKIALLVSTPLKLGQRVEVQIAKPRP